MSDFPIKPVKPISGVEPREIARPSAGTGGEGFSSTLREALEEVNDLQNQSTEEIGRALEGRHELVQDLAKLGQEGLPSRSDQSTPGPRGGSKTRGSGSR